MARIRGPGEERSWVTPEGADWTVRGQSVVLDPARPVRALLHAAPPADLQAMSDLLRQPHPELDGGQLLRRLADALQEGLPARVVMEAVEQLV